jgi:NAD(P)H-hydrate epimerase
MIIVTAEEMREMDRRTIENFGLPGRILMENAGRGAARVLIREFSGIHDAAVAVLAGRGNNGGDGFVIARCLFQAGIDVKVYLLSKSEKLQGDALANFELLGALGVPVAELSDQSAFDLHRLELAEKEIYVDAILGTGLNSEVRGFFRTVIDFVSSLQKPVFSVDIPSGLHADTGRPCGLSVKASCTATFAFAKTGHVQEPGASFTGPLYVIDIGIPPHVVSGTNPTCRLLEAESARGLLFQRPADMHKGGAGHVLIAAGSPGKTGAAAMTAISALRSGAGLATLGVPESLHNRIEPQALEVMTMGLPQTPAGGLSDAAGEILLEQLADKHCLAVGPGLGTDPAAKRLVHQLVKESPVPVVVDADGLNNLCEEPDVFNEARAPVILTPHPGEMARLTGRSVKDVQADRIGCAKAFAEKFKAFVILKGARSIIADPGGAVSVNTSGNPGMASGGMGDVLTGLVSGFIAQGYPPAAASRIAVHVHGRAADRLESTIGPFGYLASEVMREIPIALRELLGETPVHSGRPVPVRELV